MTILNSPSDAWVLVVTPRKSLAVETVSDLRQDAKVTGVSVDLANGQTTLAMARGKVVRVVTAADLLFAISHRKPGIPLTGLNLVVCENLEQLDSAYEIGVSLLRNITQPYPTRYVGFASSLNDPSDLAVWLDVDPLALHSFRPSDRDQALTVAIQTFTIPHSASLFKSMAKPAHTAIQVAPEETAIVFVPSRSQCRPIALDLITQRALEMETERGYLPGSVSGDYMEDYLVRLQDPGLIDFVSRGVGFFHEGIMKSDRNLMLDLYAEGIIRVLVVPRDSCWMLPVRAAVVVVMGTQYFHAESEGSERQLRDYALTEVTRMQSLAVRHSGLGYFYLFCQAETKDTLIRFLNEGLPLESRLLETRDLETWYRERRTNGEISNKQQAVDVFSFTFLARRILSNPAYYDCSSPRQDVNLSRIVDRLEQATEAAPHPST